MAELGRFALLLGLFLSGYAVLVDLLGAWRKDLGLVKSGRNATVAALICLTVAIAVLWGLLVRCDFSISYVAEHTSRALPLAYRLSALWAGAAGSLLLWLWLQVGFAAMVFNKIDEKEKVFTANARASVNFVSVFFFIILILDKSPFALSVPVPADGAGMNPLLQHPAMVLHPPTLFIGYAALIIPFAWVFAALKDNEKQGLSPLFIQARNWTLIAWLFLTIGIVLGAWWAYEELGWGGYWAWDPVENSSLMPWLTATALLHCFRTYKPRTAIARWLTVLSLVTFSLCIFGTFLTRYGLVSSVHAFPEPGLGILFLVLLVHIWVMAAVLLWRKYRSEPIDSQVTGLPGRKFIRLNNWLMVLLTFVILTGTLFPFLSGLFTEQKISLKPDYFTKITAPLGLALLLLLGMCPYLLRNGISKNWRMFGVVIVSITTVIAWLLTKGLAVPFFIICGFAAINLTADIFNNGSGMGKDTQTVRPRKTLRWYGARIVHISVVLIFIGITGSSAYEIEKQAALSPGESVAIGKFNVKFGGLKTDRGPNYTAMIADITVSKDQEPVARLNPSLAFYSDSGKQASEVDIKRSLGSDIYIALTAVDRNSELVNLRMLIKPLINWIWIGSAGLVLGTGLVLISFYRRSRTV
ncbi:MAG TPA: heme lyase CcmF/NrfE family subunit [Phycisphaerales bacterium]|nr:heme lyase CcmF/NrfE family subunit [Phycisphaerales bacterium]